jgi:hypothetical protein
MKPAKRTLCVRVGCVAALFLTVCACAPTRPLQGGKAATPHKLAGGIEQTGIPPRGQTPPRATRRRQENHQPRGHEPARSGGQTHLTYALLRTFRFTQDPGRGPADSRPRPHPACNSSKLPLSAVPRISTNLDQSRPISTENIFPTPLGSCPPSPAGSPTTGTLSSGKSPTRSAPPKLMPSTPS